MMLNHSNPLKTATQLNLNTLNRSVIDPNSFHSTGITSALADSLLPSRARSSLIEIKPQGRFNRSKVAALPALFDNSSLKTAAFNPITDQAQTLPKVFHQAAAIGKAVDYHYSASHSSVNQILPGVELSTTASVDVHAEAAARLSGEVSGHLAPDQVAVRLEGEAFVGASATVEAAYQSALTLSGLDTSVGTAGTGNADAIAGANASGQANLGLSSDAPHIALAGEAFAGSRATAEGSAGLTVNGETLAAVHAGVEAQAGVGVSGKLNVGYTDGQLQFEMGAGLALGIGASVELGGSIDVPDVVGIPLATTVGVVSDSIATAVGVVSEVGATAKEITTDLASGVADIGSELASGDVVGAISEVGETAVEVVSDVVVGAVEIVSDVASGIVDVASDVVSGVKQAAKKVGRFFRRLF